MTLFLICVKIFFARILDVTIATLRQTVMLKGKILVSCILAFLEVFIWFVVAREALTIDVKSIFIPIFYALGYSTGTLLGFILSKYFVKGQIGIQVVINEKDNLLLNALKARGYEVSIVHLENPYKKEDKKMLFLEVEGKSLKKVETLIKKTSPNAFLIISEPKRVEGGIIK